VEPNPGPRHGALPSAASLVAQVVSAVTKAVKKSPAIKKGVSAKRRLSGKPANPGNRGMRTSGTQTMVSAPISRGVQLNQKYDVGFDIPFSGALLQLLQPNASAVDTFHLTDGTINSDAQATGQVGTCLTIAPGYNVSGGNPVLACVPVPIQSLSQNFLKWRFKKLLLTWCPVQPTSQPGNIAIAVVPEPSFQGAAATTSYALVSAIKGAQTTPVWAPLTIDMTSCLDSTDGSPSWKYRDATTGTGAAETAIERQQYAGLLLVGSVGLAGTSGSGNTIMGVFTLSGILQLRDLCTTTIL
jgi:hypothetical protein